MENYSPSKGKEILTQAITQMNLEGIMLVGVCVCVRAHTPAQSTVRLFETPWSSSPLGSSVHGIFQARILDWVVISFSRASS